MRRMITRIASVFFMLLLLSVLTACKHESQTGIRATTSVSTDAGTEKTEATGGAASVSADNRIGKGKLTGGTRKQNKDMLAAADEEKAQEALDCLRDYMAAYAPQAAMAAAYLGYREADDTTPLTEWLWNNAPELMEEMPFIQMIPPERFLGSGYGDLYCIVPRDDKTTLSVNHLTWRSTENGVSTETDEVFYREEYAKPVLIFSGYNKLCDEPDIEIVAYDSNGAGAPVKWHPIYGAEQVGKIDIPTGEDGSPLIMDFTDYSDARNTVDAVNPDSADPLDEGWWFPPQEEELADTCWVTDGWSINLLDGGIDSSYTYYLRDGGASDYAGVAELYRQYEEGQEYQLLYSGVWRMEDDCLRLIVDAGVGDLPSDASGLFPVLIDPSGDYLHIQQDRDNGMRPPFFDDDMSSMELIRSYG